MFFKAKEIRKTDVTVFPAIFNLKKFDKQGVGN